MTLQPRIPTPEGLNLEFYRHAEQGVLHLQQCISCGRHRHPPRYLCPHCASAEYRWTPSHGKGRLFTWTVTHFPFDRGWAEELPYATVAVELQEGVRVVGALAGLRPDELREGMALVAELDTESFGFPFLRFVSAE